MQLQTSTWGGELHVLVQLSWPVISTNLLAFMLQVVGQVYIGHLGAREFAACALGNSYYNMVWYFVQGAGTALDTLASQAYGASDTELVLLWSQRTALLLGAFCVPLTVLMYFSEAVMVGAFGLPGDLCADAATFVRWLIPGTWCWALYLCVQKYQQSQNVMMPSVVVAFFANIVNWVCTHLLIETLGFGFVGAPMATSVARLAMLLAILMYTACTPAPKAPKDAAAHEADKVHGGRKLLDCKSLAALLKLALAGGWMMGLEAWCFEIMTMFAGQVGKVALDAHNICMLLASFSFLSFPLGISSAATIRVGNLIGAEEGGRAKRAAAICLAAGVAFMSATGLTIYLLRYHLAGIFSDDMPVINLTARLTPIASMFAVVDGFQGVAGGIFRGLGRQSMLANINLLAFWVVAVPLAYTLCFKEGFGVFGLWWALFAGLATLAAIFAFLWFRVDWQAEARKAALCRSLLDASGAAAPASPC